MRIKSVLAAVGVTLLTVHADGQQIDKKFQGIWSGTETIYWQFRPKRSLLVAIDGTNIGIAKGIPWGRFKPSRSEGNVIHMKVDGVDWEFSLSPDAKTLTMSGWLIPSVWLFRRGGVYHSTIETRENNLARITATLNRE
jgi:hypothetical protein